jgi:hypothetical protein
MPIAAALKLASLGLAATVAGMFNLALPHVPARRKH